PTAGYEDRRGDLWVAYRGRGLVHWIRDLAWERWPRQSVGGEAAAQILRSGSALLAVTHGGLYRFQEGTPTWQSAGPKLRLDTGLSLGEKGLLLASREHGLIRMDAVGRILGQLPEVLPRGEDNYRGLVQDSTGGVWAGNKISLVALGRDLRPRL